MRNTKPFAAELLGQEGLAPGQLSDAQRKEILAMLEVQWIRTRRMKWVAIGSWILVPICFIVLSWLDAGREAIPSRWQVAAGLAMRGLLLIAVIMTVSYYVRYRATSAREIRIRLAEIEAKLQKLVEG